MRSLRIAALSLALTLLFVGGCKGGKGGWGKGGFSMPPMAVETDVATLRSMEDRFATVGSLDAADAVTVASEISGLVISLPFQEGGVVSRGDLIALLDDNELSAEHARAAALKNQSLASFNRIKSIVEQGAGSKQDLDDASAALKVAEANEAFAQARLDKTRITAPFGGIVGARRVSPGTFMRPGDPITDLARIDELRVNFSVPEKFLSKLHHGSDVTVSTTAYPDHELTGKIDVVEPILDPGTRSAKVVAKLKNPEGQFRPGMSASVTAVLSKRADALVISSEAVVLDHDQAFVFLIKDDSTVSRTAIQLGIRLADVVEVTGGLKEGQRVVRAGHQKIFDGAKVIPVAERDSSSAGKSTSPSGKTP